MKTEVSGAVRVSNHRCCVAFDRRTGRILHVHESITIDGGEKATEDSLEKRVRELASMKYDDLSSVSVLILDPADMPDTEGPFMVDIEKKVIMQTPRQGRGAERS